MKKKPIEIETPKMKEIKRIIKNLEDAVGYLKDLYINEMAKQELMKPKY